MSKTADVAEVIRWHEGEAGRRAELAVFRTRKGYEAAAKEDIDLATMHDAYARAIREMQEERDRYRDALEAIYEAGPYEAGGIARRALSPNDREAE